MPSSLYYNVSKRIMNNEFNEVTVTGMVQRSLCGGCCVRGSPVAGALSPHSGMGDTGLRYQSRGRGGGCHHQHYPTLPTHRQQIDTGTGSGVVVPPPTTTIWAPPPPPGPQTVSRVCGQPGAGLLHPTINKWGGVVSSSSHHHHHHHSKG